PPLSRLFSSVEDREKADIAERAAGVSTTVTWHVWNLCTASDRALVQNANGPLRKSRRRVADAARVPTCHPLEMAADASPESVEIPSGPRGYLRRIFSIALPLASSSMSLSR